MDALTLPPAIERQRDQLAALCRQFQVRTLELFGSAATGRFDDAHSDFDFLVTFKNPSAPGIARVYLGLAEGLEQILGRPVDLITPESVRNPYFREAIDNTRRVLYDDRNQEAPS